MWVDECGAEVGMREGRTEGKRRRSGSERGHGIMKRRWRWKHRSVKEANNMIKFVERENEV